MSWILISDTEKWLTSENSVFANSDNFCKNEIPPHFSFPYLVVCEDTFTKYFFEQLPDKN